MITSKPTVKQLNALVELAHRVEALWQLTLRRLQIAEAEARRDIPLWGREDPGHAQAVTREDIEKSLSKQDGAYQRLRRVMDAWAALWFWPLTDTDGVAPPTLDQWIEACEQLLGVEPKVQKKNQGMTPLDKAGNWEDLNNAEELDLYFNKVVKIDEVLESHPWLKVCESVANRQGFFHWELDFATVFARDGFSLQVGNPPWVRPQVTMDSLLAEGDPWWQLAVKPSEDALKMKRSETLIIPGIKEFIINSACDISATNEFLGSTQDYGLLEGMQTDLYRCFMQQTWRHFSSGGIIALVHPESHFTDRRGQILRENTYVRLRRHWQFTNELRLYEIDHKQWYGIHVYGDAAERVQFIMASSLYHPNTVERSLYHDGTGAEPGVKDLEGKWDLRPHRGRIISVSGETLRSWHEIMEDAPTPIRQTKMLYTVNTATMEALEALSGAPRVSALGIDFSAGWHEAAADRRRGYFETNWGIPKSWDDAIIQGSHLYVCTPMNKSVSASKEGKPIWSRTDLETLATDALPATEYKPAVDLATYDAAYNQWSTGSARAYYRVAWRCMGKTSNERMLIPALIPPGAAHPDAVSSAGIPQDDISLCLLTGFLSSLLADFSVRVAPSHIRLGTINRLPLVVGHPLQSSIIMRALRLNCLTSAYANLWGGVYVDKFKSDRWTGGKERENRPDLSAVTPEWTANTPLRMDEDRRQALVEIDALVALMLGVAADQLCTIYRTQFGVLYGYDHKSNVYDANGRLVPNSILSVWRKRGDNINKDERAATNQAGNRYIYELPFRLLDREKDMRAAYTEFERRLAAL